MDGGIEGIIDVAYHGDFDAIVTAVGRRGYEAQVTAPFRKFSFRAQCMVPYASLSAFLAARGRTELATRLAALTPQDMRAHYARLCADKTLKKYGLERVADDALREACRNYALHKTLDDKKTIDAYRHRIRVEQQGLT
jgi:hypothetical protein